MMRENIEKTCSEHRDRSDCPDCLIEFNPEFERYGILIHDGGSSMVAIEFCPWCGTDLSIGE
ncbi:MAG TPA: hypothetical protein DD861_09765 [Erythrobacter sp.]|nr:hypothetical protein [Erythrobacter sp.]